MTMSAGVRLDDEVRGKLHALAVERAERHRAPAIAYGVVRDGQLLAAGGVGDPGDGAGAPDERTLFRIASMTKSFTGALFGRFTVGATVAGAGVDGDGAERATLRWHGERGDMDVTLVLRAGRVRLDRLKPRPVPDA